jgi:D-aminopeptidase
MRPGKRNLITDVAGLLVGQAQDQQLKSGVTVLTADKPFTAAVHVMGGAPGTRETDLLAADKQVQEVEALVLSGGSAFGLDAASGVADAMLRDGRGYQVGPVRVPIVPGAILFDLINGGDKNWDENPYKPLGEAAYSDRATEFSIGTFGAGTGATAGPLKGGIGSASLVLDGRLTVGALVAVNSMGAVTDAEGRFLATPWEMDAEFGGSDACARPDPGYEPELPGFERENTTIAIVATDAALTQAQATRLAIAAHDGMARAIHPSHTPFDGDLVFAAATGQKPLADPVGDPMRLGHAAAVALTRAIARGVYEATPSPGDICQTWHQFRA